MIPLARAGYTAQEIRDALHAVKGSRKVRFKYRLLDQFNNEKGELNNVEGGKIKHAAFSQIKRTAKFNIIEGDNVDFLKDRIQPVMELNVKNNWIAFPLGVFLLSSPKRRERGGKVLREVEAYDGLIVLLEDKFDEVYTVTPGTNYKDAVVDILQSAGITQFIIEDTDKTTPVAIEFEVGESKLSAVNSLLTQINFTPVRVDVNGNYTAQQYVNPAARGIEYNYQDNEISVLYNGMIEDFDLFGIANKWIVVLSNPEQPPLKSVVVNENPDSLTSVPSRGRTITDFREIDNIADQQALNAYTERLAFEASQVYGKLVFETAIMPQHDYMDLLRVNYGPLGINENFFETSFEFDLTAGAKMRHEVRRVITI